MSAQSINQFSNLLLPQTISIAEFFRPPRIINDRLRYLLDHIEEHPEVHIKYFVPDAHKSGGAIIEICGKIVAVSEANGNIIMTNGNIIPINNIVAICKTVL